MSIAIISDIHSNLEALQAAFKYIDAHQIKSVYCLGDSVGYGPDPNECLSLIRDRCTMVLLGNHDYTAVNLDNLDYFNTYAREAILWTHQVLADNWKDYLKNLPLTYSEKTLRFVHASPDHPTRWNYVLSLFEAQAQMRVYSERLCFIGHSHVPVIFGNREIYGMTQHEFAEDERYIINVGSVGQPRDGDARLCFVEYDEDRNAIQYIRLEYDVRATYNKIMGHHLPHHLAERLLHGY